MVRGYVLVEQTVAFDVFTGEVKCFHFLVNAKEEWFGASFVSLAIDIEHSTSAWLTKCHKTT